MSLSPSEPARARLPPGADRGPRRGEKPVRGSGRSKGAQAGGYCITQVSAVIQTGTENMPTMVERLVNTLPNSRSAP